MLSFLRHLDPAKEMRELELKEIQRELSYNYSYLEGIALAHSVPIDDHPSPTWIQLLVNVIAKLAVNEAAVAKSLLNIHAEHIVIRDELELVKKELAAIKERGIKLFLPTQHLANEYKQAGMKSAQSFQQYQQFFERLPLPASRLDDHLFARMTLAGPLPNKLMRIRCLPDDFPVTNSHYQSAMGSGDTLEEALEEGRVFLWDFRLFDGFPCGTYPFNQQCNQTCIAIHDFYRQRYYYRSICCCRVSLNPPMEFQIIPSTFSLSCGKMPYPSLRQKQILQKESNS